MSPPHGRLLLLCLLLTFTPPAQGDSRRDAAPSRADDPLPAGAVARLGTTRFRHSGWVWHLAFSPDGKTLAAGGVEDVVRFWDVKTGRQVRVSPRFFNGLNSLAYSPDGATLALVDWNQPGGISLLDAATGIERRFAEFPPEQSLRSGGGAGAIAFSPDGKTIASTPAGQVALYDAATLRQTAVLGKHDHDNVPQLAFSPDGRTLASAGQDATIRLWDVARRKARFVLRSEDTMALAIVFSRDGKWLISGGGTQKDPYDWASSWKNPAIRVWDTATGKQLRVLKDTKVHGCIRSLAPAPDGRTLAASCEDTLRLWDVKEGKLLRSLAGASRCRGVAALQFSPDGKRLAGGSGNTVALWETASGRLLNLAPEEPAGAIHCVAASHDGRLLAAGDDCGLIFLWDFRTRRLVRRFRGHPSSVHKLVFSPDDKTLASSSDYDRVRLWDVANGRQRYQFPADPPKDSQATSLTFSPDGKLLASAYFSVKQQGGPRGIHLLDAATGAERQNLTIGDALLGWFIGIGFSPDGRHLVGTTNDGETDGWRREADRFVKKGVICRVPFDGAVAYSPDGFLLVEGVSPAVISLRDWDTGKSKRDLSGLPPLGGVRAFSRDGRYLASGPILFRGDPQQPRDTALRVCEMASGQEVLRWRLPPNTGVHALTFAADGRTLIAGMTDTTVLLWDVFPAARPAANNLPAMWADLAAGDARRAHRALTALWSAGDNGVTFLTRSLQPIRPPALEQLTRWIADLDSDEFAVREKATQALTNAAEFARPALVRARAGKPPLERRRRLELLLETLDNPVPCDEVLRHMRAVTVLEYLATPPAQRLLRRLSAGAPQARLTHEAKASLQRLERRRAQP